MYTVSNRWDTGLRGNPTFKTVMDLYYDPASGGGAILTGIELDDWSVEIDRRSLIRRTAQVSFRNDDLFDRWTNTHQFEAYSSEIVIRCGLVYSPGDEELIPLGHFRVEDLSWSEADSTMHLVLNDRSRAVQRHLWSYPVSRAGFTVTQTVQDIVGFTVPEATTVLLDTDLLDIVLPGGTTYRGDNLGVVNQTSGAIGGEFYFDADGAPHIGPVPFVDPLLTDSQADWIVDVGEMGVLVSADRSISRTDTNNWVVVGGAPATETTPQPYAVISDLDPLSPTYYWGPFGKSERIVDRQELTTYSQCLAVCEAEYRKTIGLAKKLSLKAIMNPALTEGDIISVQYLDGSTELHVVDRLSMDKSGGMDLSTRKQTV